MDAMLMLFGTGEGLIEFDPVQRFGYRQIQMNRTSFRISATVDGLIDDAVGKPVRFGRFGN
ncbi:MAG: hypothetical protein IPH20_19180 [Bacteroidales bacterium]|nr:hypothetical protein [Bacteroidales bacterium]